jgi:hypothetical protein
LVKWVSADLSTPQLIFVCGLMTTQHLWLLFGASLCLAAGYHLLTLSMRLGDMSVIGPFR